jgi:phenylacetate-CoA ligase
MTTFSLLKDIYLTASGILKYKFFLSKSQYWSKERMELYQYRKLKKLLIESYNNVEYYRDLFNTINFSPYTDFKRISDIRKIPILTKQEAIANRDKLINPKYKSKSLILRTSGSTGNPFEILVSNKAWIMEQAVVWRHWSWGGYKFRDSLAMIRSFAPKEGESIIRHEYLRNFTYYSPFHLNDKNIEKYLIDIQNRKVKVLRGYPSSIATIAEFVLKNQLKVEGIKMILTASEVLTIEEKKLISMAFNSPIFNHYGLAEVCVMMGSCSEDSGLHNYDEYGYCELIDDENGIKKIIGTNLHNYAMPLIRYETGDIAESNWKSCTCGRALPTIDNVIGRKDSNIITPEGFKIPTVNFYTMFEQFTEIISWQIVQYSMSEVHFIIHSHEISENRKEKLRTLIRERLSANIEIKLLVNERFVLFGEGKKNPFVSLINKKIC